MPFGSVFNTYHGVPILGCATTDSTIFLCKIVKFSTVLGIFGVPFVRDLYVLFLGVHLH